jgi:excinuclease UvrABC ATPase subunit
MTEFLALVGTIAIVFVSVPIVMYVVLKTYEYVRAWRTDVCPKCDGAGGWYSLYLIFTHDAYVRCHRCDGTGKWRKK